MSYITPSAAGYIDYGNNAGVQYHPSNFLCATWVKSQQPGGETFTANKADRYVMGLHAGAGFDGQMFLAINDGTNYYTIRSAGPMYSALYDNNWHLVAGGIRAGVWELTLDGVNIAASSTPAYWFAFAGNDAGTFYVGNVAFNNGAWQQTCVAEAAVWSNVTLPSLASLVAGVSPSALGATFHAPLKVDPHDLRVPVTGTVTNLIVNAAHPPVADPPSPSGGDALQRRSMILVGLPQLRGGSLPGA